MFFLYQRCHYSPKIGQKHGYGYIFGFSLFWFGLVLVSVQILDAQANAAPTTPQTAQTGLNTIDIQVGKQKTDTHYSFKDIYGPKMALIARASCLNSCASQ